MKNRQDERGYNQVWGQSEATLRRAERRCEYLISKGKITEHSKVLEIGCGLGKNAFLIAQKTNAEVIGVDLSEAFIQEAQRSYQVKNLRFSQGNFLTSDNLLNEKFDIIVGNGILHHLIEHLEETLQRIQQMLVPSGRIVFLEPNLFNPYVYLIFSYKPLRKWAKLEPEEMAFSSHFIYRLLEKTGYVNIEVEFKDFLLPGIPSFLISPSIIVGDLVERLPLVKKFSQSIFISATRGEK